MTKKKIDRTEPAIHKFLKDNAIDAAPNEWFTHRVINRLPREHTAPGRWLMTIVTIITVILCYMTLRYVSHNIMLDTENNFSPTLLSIYAATMGAVVLTVLQVIRLIKTYF